MVLTVVLSNGDSAFILEDSNSTVRAFTLVAVGVSAVVEAARLALGYSGNLREKIPQLAGLFILSIFPQTLLIVYLAYYSSRLPVDVVLHHIMLFGFIIPEIFISVFVIRSMIKSATTKLYLSSWYPMQDYKHR
ncbi:exportin-6 protein [Planoprotostelium fungivorum]|uniref:Exportin-6 protein n=1 Tax=Planoprotostelium fungivorum TaxID=1890364 RepID=A0A2P6NUR5_9EUKA|nr:exportin-6 protein [Planoprotostelium fungivorum]